MKVYLVRHGQTAGNLVHLYQNDADTISEKGIKEAKFLAERFRSIPLDLIIPSPYSRAHETAQRTAELKNLPITTNDLLVEKRWPKEIEGKAVSDPSIQEIRKLIQENEYTNPDWRYSNEERYVDVRERCIKFLAHAESLAQKHSHVLVVSHAHILKVMLSVIIHGSKVPAQLFRDIFHAVSLHNTGITVLEYADNKWHLVTINDHAHLGEYHRQPH